MKKIRGLALGAGCGGAALRLRSGGRGLRPLPLRAGGAGPPGGLYLPQGGGVVAHCPGIRGAHGNLGGCGHRRHQRAAQPHRPGGRGSRRRRDVRGRCGQSGGLWRLLRALCVRPAGGHRGALSLRGRAVDPLLRPAGGAHLQHQAPLPRRGSRLGGPAPAGISGQDRFHRPRCVRLLLHRPGHSAPSGGWGPGRDSAAVCPPVGGPGAGQLGGHPRRSV